MTCYKIETLGISVAGFIVSLFWYWANKGYYYWNINFITLVNHYEKNLLKFKEEERVYFVFANKNTQNSYLNPLKGANISTSKLSILLSFIVTLFWGSFSASILYIEYISCVWLRIILSIVSGLFIVLLLSFTIAKKFLYSYHSHFPDLKITPNHNNNFEVEDEIQT